ncbi:MAG: cysteine--tRNA ligase [Candidatus Staskawiczbacteria bacterium RIFCSPLOWO2_01_FULL_33_9]|uniref:Cysteine--tRNA ligase n=1 Tax=Candidatus Staskawiczbacteria bacterium RIFCSPLOWO2_01_FULL_33_9 TaxID=1802211 RepID=A0A1G2I5E4_9BACT|nr:MAG: cysteine--tRNA ligase [Candidatus Staskawiczbacteria bacterium RIFCSPLOWO2_01_FULL_33_9]
MSSSDFKIHNTISGKKEKFLPLKKGRVNLFVCGPTVYDFSHIGHAKTYVVFDAFAKYLRKIGFKVFYLQNITDLDDKIIAEARNKGVLPKNLALVFEKEYLKEMKNLGINSVTKYARATNYIKEMINQIERLLKNGYAYKLEDGIYYDISKFKNYGKLSGRTLLEAEDGVSRIDYSKDKKNRGDFCLWKLKQDAAEPSWQSPFGEGRPGWHIEDTAITEKFFGSQYDIHGGSRDLMFPHHEAEISQMEAISGKKPFVKYWMHTGFLTISGQKMGKSFKNFITISDFLKRHTFQQLRFLILKNLWSSPIDYSESSMIEVKSALEKIEEFLRKINEFKIKNVSLKADDKIISKKFEKAKIDFYKELSDDFNTSKAFAVVFNFIKEANKVFEASSISKNLAKKIYTFFEEINQILGIIDFKKTKKFKMPSEVKKLIKNREKYRKEQNWQKADEVRMEIEKFGYLVEDKKEGQSIKKIW